MRFFAVEHKEHHETWLRLCEQSVSLTFTSMSLGGFEVTELDDLWVEKTWRLRRLRDDVFSAGEALQLLIAEGEYAGMWAPCHVESLGAQPDTYNIRLASVEKPIPNVPPEYLRKTTDIGQEEQQKERMRSRVTEDLNTGQAAKQRAAFIDDLRCFALSEALYAGSTECAIALKGHARASEIQQHAVDAAKKANTHMEALRQSGAFPTGVLRSFQSAADAIGQAAATAALEGRELEPKATSVPDGVDSRLWICLRQAIHATGVVVALQLRADTAEERSSRASGGQGDSDAAWERALFSFARGYKMGESAREELHLARKRRWDGMDNLGISCGPGRLGGDEATCGQQNALGTHVWLAESN